MTWVEWFEAGRRFLDGLTMFVFSIGVFILFVIALINVIRVALRHSIPNRYAHTEPGDMAWGPMPIEKSETPRIVAQRINHDALPTKTPVRRRR